MSYIFYLYLLRIVVFNMHLNLPGMFGGVRVARPLVFYVVLLCVFTSLVACCDVCYNCRIKKMFGSS